MTLTVNVTRRVSQGFTLDVAVTAPPGITMLFGASGSGKTTLLRCVAGLTTPDDGHVEIGNRVLFDTRTGVDVPVRDRRIGYVFQQAALFPHMTVHDNIDYGLSHVSADERRQRVSRIAESFRIAHLLHRRPSQISGGERQRAALARALVPEPDALLLDEPLSALDHAIQSHIMDDLRRVNDVRRIPMLYVTHSHREVYALGERAVVIDGGRVIASGTPHDVLDHPEQAVLANLAGFENVFDATVVARRERGGTMECRIADSTTELEVPLNGSALGATVRVAIRAGDILIGNEEPRGISARNVLRGRLLELRSQGPTMVAVIDAGARFVAYLTPSGAESLGLTPGDHLWLIIKTYSCRIVADTPWHS